MNWRDDDDNEPVELDNVECIYQTDRAIRVMLPSRPGRPLWIPQSQVTADSEVYASGHRGKLVITAWFARQEGLDK